ncbi:symmetrical bis(5'-nucleosyl)-tetraphosphatase [Chitinibacter bivalviorum]|uniref:bis(5'-nucleosyl)-tetraphosphatase (symmetrical) n=1 Tax=Chitinibacter bivalviorum TaxID=2739434 RepID=A0A7H9BMT3_9NEIS|nr:symmetrical bis(5'-nucleosyl)-tetraphosphatase [Chitinibacter bivalviorum]QLG88684.1 symmetrical bis(5'-nucleosyl)-tetraphosphatase [Chitinibacter bivalviorum]
MATYVVGDVQGCFDELSRLMDVINFNTDCDRIIFVGDLVNRGPASLRVLQWVYQNRHCASTVLGNHDLHLLACWLGISSLKDGDTINEVLQSSDASVLLCWLSQQPLMLEIEGNYIVHAGLYPGWGIKKALKLAESARIKYSGADKKSWFSLMYGNKPIAWSNELDEAESFRFTINAFTRMRFCTSEGLDFKYKGELIGAPESLTPWFSLKRKACDSTVIFGHWSALGLYKASNLIGLDTGAVWGGQLSAVRLSDLQIYQVQSSHTYQSIEI